MNLLMPHFSSLRLVRVASALLAMVILSACTEGMRESFGYGKQAPDEFLVLTKSPLVIPPDYALRPPSSSADKSTSPSSAARAALLGQKPPELGPVDADVSDGEKELLKQSGASSQQDTIRQRINSEVRNVVPQNRALVERLAAPPRAGPSSAPSSAPPAAPPSE